MKRVKIIDEGRTYWIQPASDNPRESGADTTPSYMYLLSDEADNVLSCITFTWSRTARLTSKNLVFRSDPEEELTYLWLLPYLPHYFEEAKNIYPKCFKYIFYSSGSEGLNAEGEQEYSLPVTGSFMKLLQKYIFGGSPTDDQIRKQVLKALYSHWLDDTETKVPLPIINIFVPVEEKSLRRNIIFLRDENLIEVLSTDQEPIISAKITNAGIKFIEDTSEFSIKVNPDYLYKTLMINNVTASTEGNNSPIIIDSNNINIAFNDVEIEIEHSDLENKEEVLAIVEELKKELNNSKDPEKVNTILTKLKNKAAWVNEKIVSHPLIAQILAQIFAKKLGIL